MRLLRDMVVGVERDGYGYDMCGAGASVAPRCWSGWWVGAVVRDAIK